MHEGSAKLELKSICRQHHIQYLITTKETAKKILSTGYFWHRHSTEVVEEFEDCVLVSLCKKNQAKQSIYKPLKLAVNY